MVSLQIEQLGHLSPRCAYSFCFDKLASTAETPNTCFPAKSWNIFGRVCKVLCTSFHATSSKCVFGSNCSLSSRLLASCLCAANRRVSSVFEVALMFSTIIMTFSCGSGLCGYAVGRNSCILFFAAASHAQFNWETRES